MLNKKGFSLIEVIICLAMMAILSVSAFSLSGHIKYANLKKCVKQLNQELETARMTSMSKTGKWKLFVYKKDDGVYYCLTTSDAIESSKEKKIGSKNMKVFCKEKGCAETEVTAGGTIIHIQFSKGNGNYIASDGSLIYESIRVAEGSSDGYTIKLVEKTGKHYID